MLRDDVSMQINGIIASYRANILAAYDSLIKEGWEPNCFAIKERMENKVGRSRMLLSEFSKYCDKRQKEVGIRITQLTANKYHRLLRYMTEYTKEQYEKDDLPLYTVTYEYVDGLNTFMQTAHRCKNNGAVNLLCCLKNFILYAIRNEWVEKNPFQYYKMKIDKTNVKIPLTKEELDTLIRRELPNDRLDRIRDVFAFCCFTGLAFTDVDNLRKEHLSVDKESTIWIHKPREKTSVLSRVPLLAYPVLLLEKYKNDPLLKTNGKLIPVPSNQKMNSYLKEIADLCNIPKNLTTHTARHTFATLAIEYGMPIDIIAKILGHTNTAVETDGVFAGLYQIFLLLRPHCLAICVVATWKYRHKHLDLSYPGCCLIDYFQSVSGKIDIHLVSGAVLHMPDGVGLQHELPEFHPERCLQIAIGMAGMILFIQLLDRHALSRKSRRIIGQ